MQKWLLTAPSWVLALVLGGFFTLWMTLIGRVLWSESWAEAIGPAVLSGVLFGTFMGPVQARMNRRFSEAARDVPPDQIRRASTSVLRGPVPEDPVLRRAARQVALDQRDQLLGQRRWGVPLLGLFVVFLIWLAVDDPGQSALPWLAVVFLLFLGVFHLLMSRHLARRAELLAEPPA